MPHVKLRSRVLFLCPLPSCCQTSFYHPSPLISFSQWHCLFPHPPETTNWLQLESTLVGGSGLEHGAEVGSGAELGFRGKDFCNWWMMSAKIQEGILVCSRCTCHSSSHVLLAWGSLEEFRMPVMNLNRKSIMSLISLASIYNVSFLQWWMQTTDHSGISRTCDFIINSNHRYSYITDVPAILRHHLHSWWLGNYKICADYFWAKAGPSHDGGEELVFPEVSWGQGAEPESLEAGGTF